MFVLNRYDKHISILVGVAGGMVSFSFLFNERRFVLIQRNCKGIHFLQNTKRQTPASDDKQTFNTRCRKHNSIHTPILYLRFERSVNMKHFQVCLTCAWQQDHFLCTDFDFFHSHLFRFIHRTLFEKFLDEVLVTCFSKSSNHFVAKLRSVNNLSET